MLGWRGWAGELSFLWPWKIPGGPFPMLRGQAVFLSGALLVPTHKEGGLWVPAVCLIPSTPALPESGQRVSRGELCVPCVVLCITLWFLLHPLRSPPQQARVFAVVWNLFLSLTSLPSSQSVAGPEHSLLCSGAWVGVEKEGKFGVPWHACPEVGVNVPSSNVQVLLWVRETEKIQAEARHV